MNIAAAAVTLFYCSWFLASILIQFSNKFALRIKPHDFLNYITNWSFFSPNPTKHDFYLLYRDQIGDNIGSFHFADFQNNHTSYRWLFNPYHRFDNSIFKAATRLRKLAFKKADAGTHLLSIEYLFFFSILKRYTLNPDARRQFVIIRVKGNDENFKPIIVYASAFHAY